MFGALDDLLIVENTLHLAGPYCGRFLAELGADVIKIEPPGGEANRRSQPMIDGNSILFSYYNANKKSIALDLKSTKGKEVFLDIIKKADVFITNYRPKTMERLGVGYEIQSEVNPRIIYASITGFGEEGIYSDLAGFDPLAQAMSGLMDSNSCHDGTPKVNSMSLDYASATAAAVAILGAIHYRDRTGKGQRIDISMQDIGVIYSMPSYGFFCSGMKYRHGNRSFVFAPYNMYQTLDGNVMIAIGEDERWHSFLRAICRQDIIGDSRFSSVANRVENYHEVDAIVQAWSERNSLETVIKTVRESGGAAAPVKAIDEAIKDPNIKERKMVLKLDNGFGKVIEVAGSPFKMTETPGVINQRAPLLGEHSIQILEKVLGYSHQEIESLVRDNVVFTLKG